MAASVEEVLVRHRERSQEIYQREIDHMNKIATLNASLIYRIAAGRIPADLRDEAKDVIESGASLTDPVGVDNEQGGSDSA